MHPSLPPHLSHLTPPSPDEIAHSEKLLLLIKTEIENDKGWISFARYMELALHAPGLGYYSAGTHKLGSQGDFFTAPEMGNLFSRAMARQARQCLTHGISAIVELGAGSGRLAVDLLLELEKLGSLPDEYQILELSADLRQRQQARLEQAIPRLVSRVRWIDTLPAHMRALVIANEVLDAMPVHIVQIGENEIRELGVTWTSDGLAWRTRPASGVVLAAARQLALPPGYTTELHLAAHAFMRTLATHLDEGIALFIDYGFPAREYYHPQRNSGTLMCHYRQHAHSDPLCLTGLQDITAHVDFSAIARVAREAGMDVGGYAHQAQFLINCGITGLLAETPPNDAAYMKLAGEAQRLLSPAEMGELFKTIALTRNFDTPLVGFTRGNRAAALT